MEATVVTAVITNRVENKLLYFAIERSISADIDLVVIHMHIANYIPVLSL
jgi:hypothetical protein